MRSELKNWLVMIVVIAIVTYAMLGRLAHGGAPIPSRIVIEDRVPVRQQKAWLIYTRGKQYRNDRIFSGTFQP